MLRRYKFSALYLIMIPVVNWMFSWAPIFHTPDGTSWTPLVIFAGLVLVLRDFAQREIGSYVLLLLFIGAGLSYFLAAPSIALASAIAFSISELIDWAVYSYTKKPLSHRVMLSSLIAAPIDTTVFLYGANMASPGVFSLWSIGASVACKLAGAALVAYLLHRRESLLKP